MTDVIIYRDRLRWMLVSVALALLLTACAPSPEMNVLGYWVSERLGTLEPVGPSVLTGSLIGRVMDNAAPVVGASVVVAERTGRPHSAKTDQAGRYRIDGVPVGQYVPSAIAPGYDEAVAVDSLGIPRLATVAAGMESEAPTILLNRRMPVSLPEPLADAVQLTLTGTYTATAPFPQGAAAQVQTFRFERDGAVNDTLRLYLPLDGTEDTDDLPLLFFSYPGVVDGWEQVSVAFASAGYGVVAHSPIAAWGVDVDAHAMDARIALQLAQSGALGRSFADGPAVAIGGSFSSGILNRLLRDVGRDEIGAWVTIGGVADAFSGAHDFYTDAISVPPAYELVIPAMGNPQTHPAPFLRLSPTYVAGQLPPTLIIHTDADTIIPIAQAEAFAAALREAGVPVETFYYSDVSHYLQIDDNMTDEGRAMYYHILDFVEQYGNER